MKNVFFIVKLVIFITFIIFFVFQCVMPQYSTGYNASIIDKYNRLSSIDEPKIIIVGDSNIAFGLDSAKIQQAFNMPVVNFGIHGGLGEAFHTDMIKSHIHEGDIVIIAPALYNNDSINIDNCVLAWIAIENNYDLWSKIPIENYKDMVLKFPKYLIRAMKSFILNEGNKLIDSPYARAAFNEYGDNIWPRPACILEVEQRKDDESTNSFCSYLSTTMQTYWNDYNDYVIKKNATLYMSSPPILRETIVEVDLGALQNQLEANLNFPMISQLENYVYPLEYFYDTIFHLNEVGLTIRTDQLISDLNIALENASN